jgi:acetyl-CoA C-acetyltransferase
VRVEELGHLDLYSCFPSAVQLAVKELGVDDTLPLTVYGGLGFAGGPWNNPVGHAIASMVGTLRDDAGSVGLVTANGGHVDKHSFGVYSTTPPADGFRHAKPQEQIDAVPGTGVEDDYQGPATVETWTVMYGRDRSPERAHAADEQDGVLVDAELRIIDMGVVILRPVEDDGLGLDAPVNFSKILTAPSQT